MSADWLRVLSLLVTLVNVTISDDYGVECLVRKYQYSATLTDLQGRSCRGNVSTLTCFGACETFEIDDGLTGQQSCVPETFTNKMVQLDNCDEGADQTIRRLQYLEVESCACKSCDSATTACFTRSSRGRTESSKEIEDKLKRFWPPGSKIEGNDIPKAPGWHQKPSAKRRAKLSGKSRKGQLTAEEMVPIL